MTRKLGALIALAIAASSAGAAQAQGIGVICAPGMQFSSGYQAGTGVPMTACAAAPSRSLYNPYVAGQAQHPNASDTAGPGQIIDPSH